MTYVFLAEGFEEIEALVPVDLLRRAGLPVHTVGVGSQVVRGAHGIAVECDLEECDVRPDCAKLVVLPGGMPGARNLESSQVVRDTVQYAVEHGCLVAAICAAPSVLGHWGLLQGKRYTCYPGFEAEEFGGTHTAAACERDGALITAKGPGAALAFGLCLVEALAGTEKSEEIERALQCR